MNKIQYSNVQLKAVVIDIQVSTVMGFQKAKSKFESTDRCLLTNLR